MLAGLIPLLMDPLVSFAQPAGQVSALPPFTCLFDTGATSRSPWSAEALAAQKGWSAIPEETLTHTFAGDAIILNDRLAVAFRRNSAGVEVYSRSPEGSRQRAELVLLGEGGAGGVLSGMKIIENSQASVMLEAEVTVKGGAVAAFGFRLTAGESLLEVRGGRGAGRLRVRDGAQYVVVPDFFADDLVVDPAAHANERRIGLPAENCVLGMTDHGGAIVTCAWPSPRQNVDLLLAKEGAATTISGYEIDLPADGRLWVALMEGAGIWHARGVKDQSAGAQLALDWKPPMPARWRADFLAADGSSVSTYFADPDAGAEPENARSNGSCRFEAGRALVRLSEGAGGGSPGVFVVYPVERTRATPLTAFCLVDILRGALGVGPCQYVLDAEKLGNGESPTPDQVTHWVEKQFEKKVSKRDVDAIREQLEKMTLQVKRTDARIGEYIDFAGKVNQSCGEEAKNSGHSQAANRLAAIVGPMTKPPSPALGEVEKLAREISAQADQGDALAKCKGSLAAIRVAGAGQDYALAKLRMAARRLKQASRTLAAEDPEIATFAAGIQRQAEQMLVRK